MPGNVDQVCCIPPVEYRKTRIEIEVGGKLAEQAIRNGVKRAGPWKYASRDKRRPAAIKHSPDNAIDATGHLLSCPSSKRQQQNAFGTHALDDQMRHTMRKRHCLTGACSGDNKERSRLKGAVSWLHTVSCRLTLCRVQQFQIVINTLSCLHAGTPP